MYARVVLDTGSSPIDYLTYEVPAELAAQLRVGDSVLVPLGSRQSVGFVVGLDPQSAVAETKAILSCVESPVRLTQDLLRLSQRIADYYLCTLSAAVMAVMPGIAQLGVQTVVRLCDSNPKLEGLTPTQSALVSSLRQAGGELAADELAKSRDLSSLQRLLNSLESLGVIERHFRIEPPKARPRTMKGVRLMPGVAESLRQLTGKQAEAARALIGAGQVTLSNLQSKHGISRATVNALILKGLAESVDVSVRRLPAAPKLAQDVAVELTQDQGNAVSAVTGAMTNHENRVFLLHGVTASGKTEVYLRVVQKALDSGKSALILVPEIALTAQLLGLFRQRFGDTAAVLHSALSDGERLDEWQRIASGEARVVLGARSAVFAPICDLGLVIVDEEHDGGYKQDSGVRYNARDAALWRAEMAGVPAVLGSATPCLESYFKATTGEWELLRMPERVCGRAMPTVSVVDQRAQFASGARSLFSPDLASKITDCLAKGEQVILLQNRRAFATFLLCRDCGFVVKCPNCAVALKFHQQKKAVICHYCNYHHVAPTTCPSCNGLRIARFGIGTERVEEEAKSQFPEAKVIRMDRDTTSRKGAHAAILTAFKSGEVNILVGTQMVAKGLDFHGVTLVGIVSADTSLGIPDFRSAERTFQLVSQVSGRSGRGEKPGEVVVQSFEPEHYAVTSAVNHDYTGFYNQEIENRRELNYPPFASLVAIYSIDPVEKTAAVRLSRLVGAMVDEPEVESGKIVIVGPAPATVERIRGEYRWHLLLKSPEAGLIQQVLTRVMAKEPQMRRGLTVDVDPYSML